MIGSEIRRVVTMMPQNGEAPSQSIPLWDSLGLSSTELPVLQDRAGLAVDNLLDLKTLGIATSPDNAARYAPAVALARGSGHHDSGVALMTVLAGVAGALVLTGSTALVAARVHVRRRRGPSA